MTKFNPNQLPTLGYLCNGRLTLETGVPISTSDQTDKVTLYFTPYMGDLIYIYDGTSWALHSFTELSLNISAFTASKPYDIFIYDNAGTLTLEGLVWTNATTRATALTTQNGIYVLTGATNKRYLGTIYMDAASKCQDTVNKRYVWNLYNQILRYINITTGYASHTYATNTWRYFNNDSALIASCVIGIANLYNTNINARFKSTVDAGMSVLMDSATNAVGAFLESGTSTALQFGSSQMVPYSAGYHFIALGENHWDGTSTFLLGSVQADILG